MWRRLLTDVLMYHLAAGPETLRHTAAEAGQMSARCTMGTYAVDQNKFYLSREVLPYPIIKYTIRSIVYKASGHHVIGSSGH